MKIQSPLRAVYEESNLPGDIRRSLNFILLGNLFGNLSGIICSGGSTSMVGLATSVGADDMAFAVINAIMQLAALMQIPFSMLVNRTHKRKLYMMTIGIFSRALWLIFGFIPFIVPQTPTTLRLWTMIFLIGIISCSGALINVCWFPWFSDLAPVSIRSRWLGVRNVIMCVVNVLAGFGVSYLLDTLPPESKYRIIFLIGGTFGVLDMICFSFCKEKYNAPPAKLHISSMISNIFHNKPFVSFMVLIMAWNFVCQMSAVYYVPYSLNSMGLTNTQVMIAFTLASSFSTILTAPSWGKLIHHFGGKSVMTVGCIGQILTPMFFLFCTPGSILPALLYNLFGSLFWSGTDLASTTLQLSSSPDDTRPSYIAVFSVLSAFGCTLGSLTGGALLGVFERSGLFTGGLDRYKVLFLVSVLLRIGVVAVFIPRLVNDSEKGRTAVDLVKHVLHLK